MGTQWEMRISILGHTEGQAEEFVFDHLDGRYPMYVALLTRSCNQFNRLQLAFSSKKLEEKMLQISCNLWEK